MATSVTKAGLKAASDKVLVAAKRDLETIKLFSTDFSADTAKKGDAIAVEVLSAGTEQFGPGAGFAHATNKIAPAQITLNKHSKSTFGIGDGDALDNELDPIWDKICPTSGEAVIGDVVNDIMALLTVAKASDKLVQATFASLADFTAVRKLFINKKAWKLANSVLVLGTDAYASLLNALPASVTGNGDAVNNGAVARFLGYKGVVESPTVSTVGNAWGYIVPDGAIGVAARLHKPLKNGGNLLESGTITDESTGLVMGTRVVVDADQGETFWSVDCKYGADLTKQQNDGVDNGAPGFYALVTAV